jgi:arsenate reductase
MAEVIWNHIGENKWTAVSAGSKPAGYVHPLAVETLKEINLPVDSLESKSADQFSDEPFDLVITVCDNAKETCPVYPGATETLHWPFPDPADATGTDEEKMVVFRQVRDDIKTKIADFLAA